MSAYTILGKFLIESSERAPKADFGVRVEQNKIREIAPNDELIKKYPDHILDSRHQIILPGFINTHMHMYSVLSQGVYFKKNWADVHDKLVEFIWREIEDKLDHAAIKAGTRLSAARLIRNGITTVADIMEAPYALPGGLDVSAEIIEQSGLRGILMFEATERVNPENGQLGLQENERFIRQNPTGKGRISGMMNVHTTFSCSLPFLSQARHLADTLGSQIHMFISESRFEPLYCLRTYGMLPFEVYDSIGFLKPDVLASMAVHVNSREIPLISDRGIKIAHIPLSAANPGVGVAPISDYLAHGMTVGLTTYPFFNYFEAMRATIWMHRAHNEDSGTMPVRTVYQMATGGAAHALGLDTYIGTLEEGKFADLLLVDSNYIAIPSPENLLDLVVFQNNPGDIDTVIINGEIVMKNRNLLTIDEESAKLDVQRIQQKMWPALTDQGKSVKK